MAKRFMTTELFEDAWFMDLPAKYKLFWIYLLTKCNNSGIWQVNWKLAQFYVGDNLEPVEVKRIFSDRIKEFEDGKYWFIPKFIHFQYGDKLSKSNPATRGVIKILEDYNLLEFVSKIKIHKGASKELQSTLQGVKDKDKDKYKDEVKVKNKIIPELSEFLSYCKTLSIYHSSFDFQIEAKYNAWVENKWKDGNNKSIKNWKTKIQNTMPYFKKDLSNGRTTNQQRRKDYVTEDEYKSGLKKLYEG